MEFFVILGGYDKGFYGISMIISYVEKNNQAFTCKDFSEGLMNDEGILVDIHSVRKVLKDKMNYSYKFDLQDY